MRSDTGKRLISGNCRASVGSEYSRPLLPEAVLKALTVLANGCEKRAVAELQVATGQ